MTADDIQLFKTFGICVVAFMVIVSGHLIGIHSMGRYIRNRTEPGSFHHLPYRGMVVFIVSTMAVLFLLHALTNIGWGLFMNWAGAVEGFRDGIFYSLENYTALGLVRVDVADDWRMLAPMISLSGVFCLSWTTAVLVNLFSHLYPPSPAK